MKSSTRPPHCCMQPIPSLNPAFILFFSVLHHNFLSNSQLSPTYYIICLKANATERGTKFILLFAFCVSSC